MWDPSSFLGVARSLTLQAGRRVAELSRTPLKSARKDDHSLVTNADHESDRILREGLERTFPDHAILTEESGLQGSPEAEFVWVVDPLDGTKAYAKGIEGYSVMVGLLKRGIPCLGVVFDPLEGHLYEAVRGGGAFWTFRGERKLVRVSSRSEWAKMPIITSTGFPDSAAQAIQSVLPCPWLPAVNSVGIKVGFLVRQLADLYLNHHVVHYWDTCAPQVILEEAGGEFTLLSGQALRYPLGKSCRHEGPTVATNRIRHRTILEIIRSFTPPLA